MSLPTPWPPAPLLGAVPCHRGVCHSFFEDEATETQRSQGLGAVQLRSPCPVSIAGYPQPPVAMRSGTETGGEWLECHSFRPRTGSSLRFHLFTAQRSREDLSCARCWSRLRYGCGAPRTPSLPSRRSLQLGEHTVMVNQPENPRGLVTRAGRSPRVSDSRRCWGASWRRQS